MQVTICGPNLRDQSKGSMHVHAADCADLKRGIAREPEYAWGWTVEASSRRDIAEAIYSDHIAENPEHAADIEYWLSDVHIFPCVKFCDFCKGKSVGNAAKWVGGAGPATLPCPRCGK